MNRLALLAVLVLAAPACADVRIAVAHQVKNRPPGCCGWSSLATALNHAGLPELACGMVEWHRRRGCGGSTSESLAEQLDAFEVPYLLDRSGSLDALKAATDAGEPCIVSVEHWSGRGLHALIVVRVDATWIWFLDSNEPGPCWFRFTREDFAERWQGWLLAIQ